MVTGDVSPQRMAQARAKGFAGEKQVFQKQAMESRQMLGQVQPHMLLVALFAGGFPERCLGRMGKTASRQPVKNADLWQRLDALVHDGVHHIEWHWVKGHAGDPGNERADALANRGVPG